MNKYMQPFTKSVVYQVSVCVVKTCRPSHPRQTNLHTCIHTTHTQTHSFDPLATNTREGSSHPPAKKACASAAALWPASSMTEARKASH